MKPDDFEKRLQSQTLRKIPTEWRKEILQKAKADASMVARHSLLCTLSHQLSAILWWKPTAWAALAGMWVVIFALQSAARSHSGMAATIVARQPSTFLRSLKDEQQTLAELMGNNGPNDVDQPRHAGPKPHTERRHAITVI